MKKRVWILILAIVMMLPGFSVMEQMAHEVTVSGYGGEMVLEVILQGEEIIDIKLVSDHETAPVMNRAWPVIRERILQAQSPIVDSVSGATFTSYAVKKGVADVLRKNGKDIEEINFNTAAPSQDPVELDAVHTQIVIVGGGPAGLAAAIAAKEAGVSEVVIVEKLDILSGNGKFDMNFFDLINSQAQEKAGKLYTKEMFLEAKADSTDGKERVEAWAEGANVLDVWLRGMGIELNHSYGPTSHMAEADAYAGEHIQDGLEKRVKELGVDVRVGTKGVDLIMEDGKAVGVKVEHRNERYEIHADAIILATGGFCHNKELLAKYAPGSETVATSNQMGATGDFVPIFEKYGFQMANMDKLSVFKMIIKPRRDLTGAGDGFLLVNEKGERFVDESSSGLGLAHTILEQKKCFYIYDQVLYESAYRLKKHNDLGYHTKAETLEELAKALDIPAEALQYTVERFNKAIAGEEKDPFREKPFDRPFRTEGPFYGVQVESAIHMTKGGVVANEKAQVLMPDNSVVENLYAAGEVTATTGAYSSSVVFGRIAGQQAAEHVAAKK